MKKFVLAAATSLAVLALATSAHASSLIVTYNLSGTVTALGFVPLGPAGSGTMTIQYDATGPGVQIGHGPVHLLSYSFSQSLNLNLAGLGLQPAILTGTQQFSAPGSTGGVLNATSLLIGPGTLNLNANIHCVGVGTPGVNTGCLSGGATTGMTTMAPNTLPFPASIPVPIASVLPGVLVFNDAGAGSGPGNTVTFANVFAGALSVPGIGLITLSVPAMVGQEVNRVFVAPEPTSFSMVALGLAAACGLGGTRYARRKRADRK